MKYRMDPETEEILEGVLSSLKIVAVVLAAAIAALWLITGISPLTILLT